MYAERKWGGNDFGSDFGAPETMEVFGSGLAIGRRGWDSSVGLFPAH